MAKLRQSTARPRWTKWGWKKKERGEGAPAADPARCRSPFYAFFQLCGGPETVHFATAGVPLRLRNVPFLAPRGARNGTFRDRRGTPAVAKCTVSGPPHSWTGDSRPDRPAPAWFDWELRCGVRAPKCVGFKKSVNPRLARARGGRRARAKCAGAGTQKGFKTLGKPALPEKKRTDDFRQSSVKQTCVAPDIPLGGRRRLRRRRPIRLCRRGYFGPARTILRFSENTNIVFCCRFLMWGAGLA